jgi:hypothetical protein
LIGERLVEIPWTFFRKAALALFGLSLLVGVGSTALYMGHRLPLETWGAIFVLVLVVLTITSAILIPRVLLPNIRNPHPEFLIDDLEDEWRELQERTVSRPHLLMIGGAIAALVYLWLVFYFGKVTNAVWFGWLPVGVAAIGVALLLFAFARRTDWYNNRLYRTPTKVIVVAFAGFAIAEFLGIYMTEQVVAPRDALTAPSAEDIGDYTYIGTRGYFIWREFSGGAAPGALMPEVSVPDCDGDECAYVFLFILLIVLTVILIAGAALIPHMWVLSGLVLLTLIALLILHEMRRDRSLRTRYGSAVRHSRSAS